MNHPQGVFAQRALLSSEYTSFYIIIGSLLEVVYQRICVKHQKNDIRYVAIAVWTVPTLTLLCVWSNYGISDAGKRILSIYIPGICVYAQLYDWFRPRGMWDSRMRPPKYLRATYREREMSFDATYFRISTTPWIPPRGLHQRTSKRLRWVACQATDLDVTLASATLESVRRKAVPVHTCLGLKIFKVDAAVNLDNVPGPDTIESTLWRGRQKSHGVSKGPGCVIMVTKPRLGIL